MKIRIVVKGKIRSGFIKDGVNEYLRRISPYIDVKVESVKDILIKKKSKAFFVCLDKDGKEMDSIGFSRWFRRLWDRGETEVDFIIGGIEGISKEVLKEADCIISLSKMTLTHEFAALLITEQIYRAIKIIRGEPYHY